ncbi:MAG: hypothetical protein ACK5N0_14455 [Synechococcaceae cyanobacterium]
MPHPDRRTLWREAAAALSCRAGRGWSWRLGARLLLPLAALLATAGHGQEPPGCQLLEGVLRCVPGVQQTPLQRIPILPPGFGGGGKSFASQPAPVASEARLVLQGRAQEGEWLRADLVGPGLSPPPDHAYHWYHKPPGRLRWELIAGASGAAYRLRRDDMAYEVMVLVVLPSSAGSQRLVSNPLGPVLALGASTP